MSKKKYDIICAGEILMDVIGTSYSNQIASTDTFHIYPGGSSANLASNLSLLGNKVALIASVGSDDLGKLLLSNIKNNGVSDEFINSIDAPSTMILVTKSKQVARFEAYRSADIQLHTSQVDIKKIKDAKIFHTTCFGLSKKPARNTILTCAQAAVENDVQLSIDLNYAKKIWPKRKKALTIIQDYLAMNPLVKCSEVDYERMFKKSSADPKLVIDTFLQMGAKQVCYTIGAEGCWVADSQNETYLPARKVKIADTTGAGDAFWSGYLTAWLKNKNIVDCAKAGRSMAELKLKKVGQLNTKIPFSKL